MQLIAFDNVKHKRTYQKANGDVVIKNGVVNDLDTKLTIPNNPVNETIERLIPYDDTVKDAETKIADVVVPLVKQHPEWILTASGNFKTRYQLIKKVEHNLAQQAIQNLIQKQSRFTLKDVLETVIEKDPIVKVWDDNYTLKYNLELVLSHMTTTDQIIKIDFHNDQPCQYGPVNDHNYLLKLKTVLNHDHQLQKLINTSDTVAQLMHQFDQQIETKLTQTGGMQDDPKL